MRIGDKGWGKEFDEDALEVYREMMQLHGRLIMMVGDEKKRLFCKSRMEIVEGDWKAT